MAVLPFKMLDCYPQQQRAQQAERQGTGTSQPYCTWVMRAAMEPGVHTISDELILQISGNIFLTFKWILMMTSGQNISHYTTAKLSVHVWNHDLIWWQNKINTQKHFRKTTITSSWTLSKKRNSHHNSKGADAVKPKSEVPHVGQWQGKDNFLLLHNNYTLLHHYR